MLAFGPVPSRRLGRSLGVNNVPSKICTYACVYCQVGRTTEMPSQRRAFYPLDQIIADVRRKLEQAQAAGERVDYATFVPDGEPTLDVQLGRAITEIKKLGVKVAVISNSTLLWHEDVRTDLSQADWVSLKVDSVEQKAWRKINRPLRALDLAAIMDGMARFAQGYTGYLATETMLVHGVNDNAERMEAVGDFLATLKPACSYLSIPTRPPAVGWVQPPTVEALNVSYQALAARLGHVEYLIGYEGNAFASTGKVGDDILSITAVHPMREDAVSAVLARAGAEWSVIQELLDRGQLAVVEYNNQRFYVRRIGKTT